MRDISVPSITSAANSAQDVSYGAGYILSFLRVSAIAAIAK